MQVKDEQKGSPTPSIAGSVSMREQIEKLREVVLRVNALKEDGGDAFDLAWDDFDQIVRPDVMLAFIDRLSPELEPEPTFKTANAGFYALMYKGSGEILRIEYAESQGSAEAVLLNILRPSQQFLMAVEKVSVRRYVDLANDQACMKRRPV